MGRIASFIFGALALLLASLPAATPAAAQSGCVYIVPGAVLTAGQWNACFAAKLDNLGYVPLNPAMLVGVSPVVVTPTAGVVQISCPGCGAGSSNLTIGTTTITGGTGGQIEYNNGGVLGELGTTGSGSVALADSPVFSSQITAPNIYGGSSPSSSMGIQSTSNGSPSGDAITIRSSQIILRGIGSTPTFVQIGIPGTTAGTISLTSPVANAMNIVSASSATGTATLPTGTYSLVGDTILQTLTNKTLTSSTNSLGGVTTAFGSDAKGDIYTNGGSSNILVRLAIGSTNQCLIVTSGLPAWGSCGAAGDVASFSAGTTGLTPSSPTTGAIVLAGTLVVANGGTNCASASITCFNNITGFSAAGTTGTTSTNLVFSTSPTFVTPTLGVATGSTLAVGGCTIGSNALCVTGANLFNIPSPSGSSSFFIVNGNAASAANVAHPDSVQIAAADNNIADFYIDSYGSAGSSGGQSYRSVATLRSARGTGVSPSALIAGDEFGRFSMRGYGTSSFTNTVAAMSAIAAENFSSTNQGTFLAFRTTALGTVGGGNLDVPPVVGGFGPSGSLMVGSTQVAASFTGSISGTTLTVSSGTGVAYGQLVLGAGVAFGTYITGGSGTTWTVIVSQTVGSEAMTSNVFFATQTANDLGSGIISAQVALAVFGATSGNSLIQAPATGGGTATLFAGSDTIAGKSVANGGTNCSAASITCFNNITGFSAAGTTGTTSTNLVFSASPTLTGTVTGPDSGTWTSSGLSGIAAFSGGNLNVTSSTIPTNGVYLSNTNVVGIATNGVVVQTFSSTVGITQSLTVTGNQINSYRNNSNGASATNQLRIGNDATAQEFTVIVNSSGNSAGNGASSATVNGISGLYLQGGTVNAITISSAQLVALPALTTDATHTDDTVCWDTTSKALYFGSGTAGICLGNVSSIRFKPDFKIIADGLGVINALDPGLYHYAPGIADGGRQLRTGYTAERYAQVLPDFTRFDDQGRPNGTDMLASLPFAVRAIQQLDEQLRAMKADNDNLREELKKRDAR